MRKVLMFVCGIVAATAVPVVAQPAARGYVQGVGGSTFGNQTAPVFGGGVGINVTPTLQLTFDAGRMQDVLPKSLMKDLDALSRELELETGLAVNLHARVPALYALGGIRIVVPTGRRVRPYIAASAGMARLSVQTDAQVGGIDVSSAVENDSGLNPATEPIAAAGVGLIIQAGPQWSFTVGYQYNRIFTEDPAVNINRVTAGLNFGF